MRRNLFLIISVLFLVVAVGCLPKVREEENVKKGIDFTAKPLTLIFFYSDT